MRDGLRRLVREGLVFSPQRGRYRLSSVGRQVGADLPPVREVIV